MQPSTLATAVTGGARFQGVGRAPGLRWRPPSHQRPAPEPKGRRLICALRAAVCTRTTHPYVDRRSASLDTASPPKSLEFKAPPENNISCNAASAVPVVTIP